MPIKSLEALCATSTELGRKQILFDTDTGLICRVGGLHLKASQIDYYFDDDCLLFAGMGDIHIHAREDTSGKNTYKEDFQSACCAALNGGVVHLADMPNNPIPPIDDESYLAKLMLAKNSALPILMYAGIGPQTKPLNFEVPYKVYMGPSIGELYFKNNADLETALEHYKNEWVSFHCEDPEILESHKKEADHFLKRPVEAEIMATEVALGLIEKFNLVGKLCHYSAGEGLRAINNARKKGIKVTCEVTPQHLYFSEEKIKLMSPETQILFQMNPPIRKLCDAEKLLEALRLHQIDYLATDHAPHSPAEKAQGMSGLTGLDTYAPFVTWLLLEKKISPHTIALIASENPGRFFNHFLPVINKKWGKGMGFLEKGYSASFTILNLKRPVTISAENLQTKSAWSPFIGETFPGSLEAVFLSGEKIITDKKSRM